MNSMVIYASRYGNTRHVAEAIAEVLGTHGTVLLMAVDDVFALPPAGIDLLVVGCPTEEHGMTEPVAQCFDRIGARAFQGKTIAAFDTRYRWPRWLSGSAGTAITRRLRRARARVIAPPESFFVAGGINPTVSTAPVLESGELDRARIWAGALADAVEAGMPVAASKSR
ncbi:MAG TPA: flavodoxin domain-containing protein [Ktedonobacterales bacterium]|nr:flavodoxin domain-containing protein [Ktedonobacterales bacterium]